ncbi:MAG TPA: FHA domain-containing protein [Steroidobacteraceae bacterium]
MAVDKGQPQDVDLDRTDRLPILDGTLFDEDVEDDAVRLDYSPLVPSVRSEFPRSSAVDLPSLAESVRSVEERIARQHAEYEALKQSYEKARDAEAVASSRSHALAADLAEVRDVLESERTRSREFVKTLAEKNAAAEAARLRIEQILRDAERYQSESHTLRDTLAARDATIVQVLHSLGERDAQLNALQREHAKVVPALEERSKAATKLEADLRAARARSESMAVDLKKTQQSVAALTAQLKVGAEELDGTRRELRVVTTQATSNLEQLRTREWRRGFDQNLFRELDAKIDAVQEDRGSLQAERDQSRRRLAEIEAKLAAREDAIAKLKAAAADGEALRLKHELKLHQVDAASTGLVQQIADLKIERNRLNSELAARDETIVKLKATVTADEAARAKHELNLQQVELARADLAEQIAALESERDRLNGELAVRDRAAAEAVAARQSDAQRSQDLATQIAHLRSEAQTQEEEMEVLVAHLREARRPMDSVEADVKRLSDELAAKTLTLEQLNEENRALRAALERTRGALEEREFLIRRLERSESNNANVLGRIQTSIERLGAPPSGVAGNTGVPVECTAELVRVDGQHKTTHTLLRRTRIGRAPGCEIQVESSSVSRHHALLHMSSRDVIIEDLNSTNGVLVNGRKVSRQPLNDGDLLTIGDAQFRMNLRLAPRVLEAPPPEPPAGA